jgi:cellulose synthase/poly-beta-1,6-N-acetylglucosamine synthase-like glycosyltransferase
LQATGDYLVIFDAEDIPDPLQLKKAVLTFADHDADLACVQAKLNYYNTQQNLLTRWFTVEYSQWFDLMLPGMQQTKLPLPLGGTSNHFRTSLLRRLGAWDPFNVTEDCDLGLRLARSGMTTTVLDSTTYEEANSQLKNWTRQRSRWIKGYLQTYLVHMRQPLSYFRRGRLRQFLGLQLLIGGKTLVLFVNPVLWALLTVYILFRPTVAGLYHTLFPTPVLYMGLVSLVFGNFLYTYSHLLGCLKRRQFGLVKWALSMPIYWLMMSRAALLALYQLMFNPHYWEKTTHGLHLRKSRCLVESTDVNDDTRSAVSILIPASSSAEDDIPLLSAHRSSAR